MKYEEYPAVVKGIEDLALTIGEKVKEKSMVGGLPKRSVPTTSIATIEGGQVKETSLKPHDSTFYASFHEVVRMDLSSVRSRFLKNAISEVKQYNDEFIQTLRPAGLVYDPFGGAQFIDWYLAVLEYYKRIGVPLSQIKWTPPVLKQLLKILKDPTSKLKISLWLEENRD